MNLGYRPLAALLLTISLSGCTSFTDRDLPLCPHPQQTFSLTKFQAGTEIDIYLPTGSRLIDENTEDARYWTWDVGTGQVSLAWISKLAREYYWEANRSSACLLLNRGREVLVFEDDTEWNAITWPINDSQSGVMLSLDDGADMDAEMFYEIAASLVIRGW